MNFYLTQKNKSSSVGSRPERSEGFTLVELLLYVTIASAILMVISLFLGALLQSRIKNQTMAEVEQQGAQAMYTILRVARSADSINTPSTGSTTGTLALSIPAIPANNPSSVSLSSGAIMITEGLGSPIALTNNQVTVSNLSFENVSRVGTSGSVRVSFTITYNNPSGRNEYAFEKTFYGSATLLK